MSARERETGVMKFILKHIRTFGVKWIVNTWASLVVVVHGELWKKERETHTQKIVS